MTVVLLWVQITSKLTDKLCIELGYFQVAEFLLQLNKGVFVLLIDGETSDTKLIIDNPRQGICQVSIRLLGLLKCGLRLITLELVRMDIPGQLPELLTYLIERGIGGDVDE